ncbi:hypothetical protein [Allomuricauda sp. M10]|uniref:hypothetical protein n=1 Tax=Allomuricauda sp. M10 TaxID=2683292 RepID=UPI001D1971B4|nr:hypothetical protein [Muricauda sp. M10]
MGSFRHLILVVIGVMVSHGALAQPYTLDKKLTPIELKLQKDTRKGHEEEKGIVFYNKMDSLVTYHYVTGHGMFQMVDVLVSSIDGEPLKVTLVKDNWEDVQEQQSTSSSSDDIVNFKVRSYGSFGVKVEAKEEGALYNITVLASKPIKAYLGSPFRKIKDSEMEAGKTTEVSGSSTEGSDNKWLYIALGVALLVIGLLAGKLLGKNKGSATLILVLLGFSSMSFVQSGPEGAFMTVKEFEEYVKDTNAQMKNFEALLKIINEKVPANWDAAKFKKTTESINKNISGIMKAWSSAAKVFDLYHGLGECMSATPIPGEPNIPSFCDDELVEGAAGFGDNLGSCSECYYQARTEFNNVRYNLEELATIYSCTKKFTDAALAFGDNASGLHAVTGLAWQNERRGIEKSITDLESAYDKKYAEFMQRLADAMQQLNICEAKFGVEDWYDRFGFIYYEFMKDKYKRKKS